MSDVSQAPGVTAAQLAVVDTRITTMLTGVSRQQAVRVQVTPDSNGRIVYPYPLAYAAGSIVAVQVTAETPAGVAYRNDASIEESSAGLTSVAILVQRIPKTLVASVLGATINVLVPVTTPVWLNIFIRATA